jgi:dTDP-4-amino-4,6-dideoxygalactose transaminase
VEPGWNSRLDEMQAAVLRERLTRLPAWTERRRAIARRYRAGLAGGPLSVPPQCDAGHVYHLFPVLAPDRAGLMSHLESAGIGTIIHYPVPIPRQPALAGIAPPDTCPVADRVSHEICSLPLHPHLTDTEADRVVAAVSRWQPTAPTPPAVS